MSLNFPDSPTDGQIYGDYIYDATDGVWNKNPQQLASRFITSTTAPANPNNGDGWLDSNTGKTYVYYYDGSSGQWIESGNPVIGYVDPYDQDSTSTGYFSLPKGTDVQRPINPSNGDMRFNTESGEPEWYSEDIDDWVLFRSAPTFSVEYLVIAGGGGGASRSPSGAGGGGAGGYRSSVTGESSGGGASAETPLTTLKLGSTYTLTVGAGGPGAPSTSSTGSQGDDSVFASITSVGGGRGFSGTAVDEGGSGGGAGGRDARPGGQPEVANQGFAGGATREGGDAGTDAGGGGGGAGSAGQQAPGNDAGDGGSGVSSSITGSAVTRAGGGAGSADAGSSGSGGSGGGGDGDSNGQVNTGSGGGAGASTNGGSGGSGVVILKYPSQYSITAGPGLTSPITNTVGDYKVTQFTGGTDTITFS